LFLRLAWPVRQLVRESRCQLIDAHFGYPEGIVAAMLAAVSGVPFAVTLRGNEPLHAESAAKRKLLAWSLRRAARVITVSNRLREFAIGLGVAPESIVTIPNGVDASVFYPLDRAAARLRFGLAEQDRVVLSAGSLIRRKGHHHVLQSLTTLRRRGVPTVLLIAGGPGREGRFENELLRLAEEENCGDHVRFLGSLSPEDLAQAMCAADVFCLASSREGWPNVLHEALACGTPAIASDVGAVRDMLPHPELGIVVPAPDPIHLVPALERALGAEWDRSAIARFGQSRSWQCVASEVLHCFRQIIQFEAEQ
ncbi:MAG: glycosyltransferase, partial [Acidobacteriaceae bacterium]|nr:glycosyltransferase [Acidobacteriaceae bacterium]